MGSFRVDEGVLDALIELVSPRMPAENPGQVEDYVVVPGGARPRYVLPAAIRHAATSALDRPGAARTAQARLLHLALPALARLGPSTPHGWRLRVPSGSVDSPSLSRGIARELGLPRVHMAVAIGPPRPNRKPLLQVFDESGETVCFGKLGVDELTSRLVRHEAAYLADHRFDSIVAPSLLSLADWKGLPLALYRPLPLRSGRRRDQLAASATEICSIAGGEATDEADALGSPWWCRISKELAALGDVAPVERALARVASRLEGVRWRFGSWHGDFTPWNAQRIGDTLYVWDWERADAPVPLGFDPVHSWFQVATLREAQGPAAAANRSATMNPGLLHQLGARPGSHRALVDCYMLELCLRLVDAAGPPCEGGIPDTVHVMLEVIASRP